MDALHREAVEFNSRGSRRSRTPGQRPTSLMAPRSGAGGCTRHPHRCAVRSSNHNAFRGCRIRDDPRLRREESGRAARLGCHHPTTVFSGRVVSSLPLPPRGMGLPAPFFSLSTSRARTNTVIVPTPKHEFSHFSAQFHPSPRPPIATSARRLPLSTHQHPHLCARP